MFYSHNYLSQKGPLGTVWCAAHLQHKLKKWQYTKTDISSTVERIMFPEAPIALRMSGHLLLGVVRIYSKKVDYLYQDCNIVLVGLKNAFSTADFTLPANANHAQFYTVTLPERFELDAMELDIDFDEDRSQDNHLRSLEDITLPDQAPYGYVQFILEEDGLHDLSPQGKSHSVSIPHLIEEDNPSIAIEATSNFQDLGPSDQPEGLNESSNEEQNTPEVRRDALPMENIDDTLEPDRDLELQILREKNNIVTPPAAMEEILDPVAQSVPSHHQHELPFTVSDHDLNVPNDAEDGTPSFRVGQSPVVEQQQPPEGRRRKRKQLFDGKPVLTNKFLKTSLSNTSDILRKKGNCPCSALGVWKLNKRLKKDRVFFDPIITGVSADLCSIFTEDFIHSNPHLASTEAAIQPEPSVPSTSVPVGNFDEEIEHIRDYQEPSVLPDILHSSNRLSPSTSERGDDFTPGAGTNLGSELVPTTSGTRAPPTSNLGTDTGPFESDMDTPMHFEELRLRFDDTGGLSDIPEMADSADGELNFLEDDNNTPAGLQGTPEVNFSLRNENATPGVDALSVRTRAVAQFLIKKSSATPTTADKSCELSMNKILEGKRRKVSARMCYETLVLKSYGLVDLEQQEPYGDITLKVTPNLSKEFSA